MRCFFWSRPRGPYITIRKKHLRVGMAGAPFRRCLTGQKTVQILLFNWARYRGVGGIRMIRRRLCCC